MIDTQLIESAQNIRKTFLKLGKELNNYQGDVKKLVDFLQEKLSYLEQYNNKNVKNIKNDDDISKVTKDILSQIEEIEVAEKRIQTKINKINKELEQLNKDEQILYQTIKERYPEMTDEQIIKEIHQNLEN